jgi:hypothetical protein
LQKRTPDTIVIYTFVGYFHFYKRLATKGKIHMNERDVNAQKDIQGFLETQTQEHEKKNKKQWQQHLQTGREGRETRAQPLSRPKASLFAK